MFYFTPSYNCHKIKLASHKHTHTHHTHTHTIREMLIYEDARTHTDTLKYRCTYTYKTWPLHVCLGVSISFFILLFFTNTHKFISINLGVCVCSRACSCAWVHMRVWVCAYTCAYMFALLGL